MNREALERIGALMGLASKDLTRQPLNGVMVSQSWELRELVLTVTDGHKAVIEKCASEFSELFGREKYLIGRDQLPIIKLILKDKFLFNSTIVKKEKAEHLTITFGQYSINAEHLQSYPNVEQVYPKVSEKVLVSFNARYIYEICKAIRAENRNENVTLELDRSKLSETGYLDPFWVTSKEGSKALLMPCKS